MTVSGDEYTFVIKLANPWVTAQSGAENLASTLDIDGTQEQRNWQNEASLGAGHPPNQT